MLRETLACLNDPDSGEILRLAALKANGGDVIDGELTGKGGQKFAIRQGIPSFVPADVAARQTTRSFAQKWAKHHYYREHTNRFYTDWYLQRYGFFEKESLREFLSGTRRILDAGTGAGRDAANFATLSNADIFAVDTSIEALEIARRNILEPRVHFIHADLHKLPFPNEFFDFINCDQVIHHTPDPHAAFKVLTKKLKSGGRICCYVYRKKTPIREFTDDLVRARISKLSADEALQQCEAITRFGQKLAELKLSVEIEEDIPALGISRGAVDIQRLFHWNIFKCFWNDEFDFFTNNIINFDWYHPEFCFRFMPDEFRSWFAEGWEIEAWDSQEAGLSCRARKK
ncbi:MAG: class I SAM-dependent methyltransferase [Planctomycetes bacterium]|nr:class I SAM-dependent methyltransferase [Planctomycetota bacterium]MBI3832844.1 class I SAM-dependent methyltransferase [Planctomycetota bacterium]